MEYEEVVKVMENMAAFDSDNTEFREESHAASHVPHLEAPVAPVGRGLLGVRVEEDSRAGHNRAHHIL